MVTPMKVNGKIMFDMDKELMFMQRQEPNTQGPGKMVNVRVRVNSYMLIINMLVLGKMTG